MSETTAPSEQRSNDLAVQAARTDAALISWRTGTAEGRRTAWELEQQRMAEEARRRLVRARIGVTVVCVVLLAVIGVGFATGLLSLPALGTSEATAPRREEPAPSRAEPPAPQGILAPLPLVPSGSPLGSAEAADPSPGLQIEPGSVEIWLEEGHRFVSFLTREEGALEMRYLDAAGKPALERWPCRTSVEGSLRRCEAGRSVGRLAWAVEHEGAAPGQWTVQVCGGEVCSDLGVFSVER